MGVLICSFEPEQCLHFAAQGGAVSDLCQKGREDGRVAYGPIGTSRPDFVDLRDPADAKLGESVVPWGVELLPSLEWLGYMRHLRHVS